VQSDRAGLRAGQPVPPPELGRITPDMVLRRPDLPGEDEFATANGRAAAIFGVAGQPVRSTRSVQALAREVRHQAGVQLPAAEALLSELGRHAGVLGLDDDSPRLVTARQAADLLGRLTGLSDATAMLSALAAATLPKEGVIYRASLNAAAGVAGSVAAVRWDVLDRVTGLAAEGGPDAEQAGVIVAELRTAARRDEHEIPLANALRTADTAATKLLLDITNRNVAPARPDATPAGGAARAPVVPPTTADGWPRDIAGQPDDVPPARPVPGADPRRLRASASQVRSVTAELLADAAAHPGATFEITWRIVAP
jgi:hypothetical protein